MGNGLHHAIREFEESELSALGAHKASGGRIAVSFCRLFPPSAAAGAGYWPVRAVRGATVAAESAAEKLVRPDTCPFCKSIIGNFMNRTSVHALADAVVGLITCDQMRRTLERLRTDLGLPVFPVQVPATATADAEDYFVRGVKDAVSWLSSFAGREFDEDAARRHEEVRREAAGLLRGLILENMVPPRAAHRLCCLFAWARPAALLGFLRDTAPGLSPQRPRVIVLLAGGVSCEEDDAVYRTLEESGSGCLPLNCTGINALEDCAGPGAPAGGFVDAMARTVFRSPACIRRRPNSAVYDRIRSFLAGGKAAGVILKTLPFCDLWFTEKERMRRSFDAPVIAVETGFGEGIRNTVAVRIEAFLESLE